MDTVILAAGRGQRLADIVPNYVKPALPIDGQPLIVRAVEQAQKWHENPVADRTIIVMAPQNTEMLCDILANHEVDVVIQRFTDGPANALLQGMKLVRSEFVLVLMSDNVSTDVDIKSCIDSINGTAIGVVKVPPQQASRFTVYNHRDGQWDEKIPISDDHVRNGEVTCWCGPLVLHASTVQAVLSKWPSDYSGREWFIGQQLSKLAPNARFVPVSTYDVGTLDHWMKMENR